MAYTDIDKPSDYFNTKLFSGNGSGGHAITSVGFAPNWVWLKKRDGTPLHHLYDTIRGVTKMITSVDNRVESTQTNGLTAFGSDGFTLGRDNDVNSGSMVSWNWKAETSFTNDASGTGIGSIDSAGSVNQDAGFSIISYTGTAANATIAHGLGSVPKMYIARNIDDAEQWTTYHVGIGATHHLRLNTNDAKVDEAEVWNDTEPTSTVFSVGSSGAPNGDGDRHIAYCFAEKQGYSKFGSYTGNGNADGTFIYTGFKPAFIIAKESSEARDWQLWDNKRLGYNASGGNKNLIPNKTDAEDTYADIDILSNGFKLRNSSAADNKVSQTYIYMAFAENPFVTSTGVPATAR